MKCSLCIFEFSQRDLYSFPFYCFLLFLSTDHWGRLSYLSLLFFGTLGLGGYIFPFLPCLLLLLSSQLFVRPPQTATLPFRIAFSWGWFWSLPPLQCFKPQSIVLQAQSGKQSALLSLPFLSRNAPLRCVHTKSLKLSPTVCNTMDCNLPGSFVHGILQARTLEWVSLPSSRGSPWHRDWTCIS